MNNKAISKEESINVTQKNGKTQKKCENCGHNVMVYHHPLSSSSLIFHNNDGAFGLVCGCCGCKNPKIKGEQKV